MIKPIWISCACAVMLTANDTELVALKQQMAALQQQLMVMQQKIQALESASNQKETPVTQESHESVAMREEKSSAADLLPEIAVVLNGGYTSRNASNTQYANASIPGFIDAGGMDIPYNAKDGFNFNYADLAVSSMVDSYLDASAIFHISGAGTIEIEEAYLTTRTLDYGLRLKAGKFKSAFGRVNEKHHHDWNFEDQELINTVLFGPEGIGGEGAQLQWTAPTSFYMMAGIELFDGNPAQGFSAKESATTGVGYLKTGINAGDATVLAGISFAQGKSEVQDLDAVGVPITGSFTDYGQTRIYGADLTLEYPLEGCRSLIWQNEWMQRDRDRANGTDSQAGYYSELLYQYSERWGGGVRYDELYKNIAGVSDNLNRTSVKLEYKPSESSRLRLQYNHDHSKAFDNQRKTLHEVMLNYTLELGAHDAHDNHDF